MATLKKEEERIPHDFPSLDSLKTLCYTFLAGCHDGEVWFLRKSNDDDDDAKTKSLFLGTVVLHNSYHANVQIIVVDNDVYVFVGLRKGSSSPIKMWRLMDALVSKESDFTIKEYDAGNATKLRGFARALFVPQLDSFVLSTALGTNKSHMFVWPKSALDLPPKCVGSYSLKRNCSTSCFFTEFHENNQVFYEITVVMSYDDEPMLAQTWNLSKLLDFISQNTNSSSPEPIFFEGKSSEAKTTNSIDDLNETLTTLRTRDEGMRRSIGWAEVTEINLQNTPFNGLFPSLLMDPESYEGDTDESGVPHGKGIRAFLNEGVTYIGDWSQGVRHGNGVLKDYNTEETLFTGEFRNGFKRGFGHEIKPNEEYFGSFFDDKRHGYGKLIFKRASSNWGGANGLVNVQIGDVFEGFFKNGRLHGCGKFEPKSSNNSFSCLLEFKSGICTSKFWGTVTNEGSIGGGEGNETDEKDRPLRAQPTGTTQHTPSSSSFYAGPLFCWICLETHDVDEDDEDSSSSQEQSISSSKLIFGQCSLCGFSCHTKCFTTIDSKVCPFHSKDRSKKLTRPRRSGTPLSRPSSSASKGFNNNNNVNDFVFDSSQDSSSHQLNKKRPHPSSSSTATKSTSKRVALSPSNSIQQSASGTPPPKIVTQEETDARRGSSLAAPVFAERIAESRHTKKDKQYEIEKNQQFERELSMRRSWRKLDEEFREKIEKNNFELKEVERRVEDVEYQRKALLGEELKRASLEDLTKREKLIEDFLIQLLTKAQHTE